MSHYGISNQKTTAGNFAGKAGYFEKKLKELRALQEKRISLGMSREAASEEMAAELAKVDAEIAQIVSQVEGDQGTGREDYYHQSGNDTLSSEIVGPLADTLGLGRTPKDGDYLALFRGINPRTNECFLGERRLKQIDKSIREAEERKATPAAKKKLDASDLGQLEKDAKERSAKEPVLGFSSCVSLQKSISVYWAQADDQTRKVIQECLMGAVNDAIAREHSVGRIRGKEGAQGAESVEGECVTLTYAHCTARRVQGEEFPDPQLHVHLERPNFVRTKDGKYLTLHAGHLYKSQKEFGAVVDIAFYQRIKKELPELAAAMVVDYTGHGLRLNESSVPHEVVVDKSKRSEQIQAEKKNLATTGQAAAQAIALRTRDGKDVELGEGLDAHWRSTIPPIELAASTSEELKAPTLAEVQRMVFRGNTVIDEFAIDAAAASLTIGRGGLADIEVTKSELFKQLGLVEIPQEADEEGRIPPKRYTTKELIDLETDCLKAVYAGLNDPRWAVDQAEVDRVIDAYELEKQAKQEPGERPFKLSLEQRQAAYDLTKEGQFSFLKGAAGVGKSATLAPTFRLYAEVFKASGRRIIGVAPANKQATELANSTGISAKTVHTLLLQHQEAMAAKQAGQRYKPENIIGRGDIVVCDEAGMLDTYAMHALVVACHQSGARLICVGDRNQHGAVETAALFGLMHEAVGDRCAKIETIARQVEQYKPTAQALYEGKVDVAIAHMLRDDQIRAYADGVNEADELVGDLFVDMKAGLPDKKGTVRELEWKDLLVLADTNEQVRALNDKIRDARFARDELSTEGSVSIETEIRPGERFTIQVAIGERLLLRKTAKDAESEPIFNGDLGTVKSIDRISRVIDGETVEDVQFTVDRDDGKTVKINASEYQALQYGYAMTGHKAQGMTVKQAYYLPAGHASLQSFYVAYTRGIHGAKTYLNSTVWPDFKKAVSEYIYKKNALDLMPEVRAAIRAGVNSGVMAPLQEQQHSVLDRLQGVSKKFEFPTLSSGKAIEQPAQTETTKIEQKVSLIPATEADIELSKTYGHTQYDMREDGQTWPAEAKRVDVIVPENPPLGADAGEWKNPGSEVPADQRRDFCETLQGMTPALITTRYRFIKPTPQEATHEQRLSAADSRRGTDRNQPGRAGEPSGRSADRGRGFGVYRLADGADRIQRDPAKHIEHGAGGFRELDPLAAGGGTPRDSLRQVPSRDLAAAGERRAEGVLPDHSDVRGRSTAELRRTGTGKPAASAVKPMRFDKQADARAIQDAKRDVDLIKFAGDLGYQVEEKKTRIKYLSSQISAGEAAVMVSGSKQIDVFRGENGEWAWYDRKEGRGGDVFKLYQRENPEKSFAQAKEAVIGDRAPLSESDRAQREHQASVTAKDKLEKRQAEIEAGTQKAQRSLGLMGRRDTRYLESRGISPEVLAETRWKTNLHGSAVFPHHDADRNICGYEYRGFDYQDKETGETKQAKGFSRDTEKGIYIANGRCANPTEIRFCESGVDTLSVYQLASPEERQRILFVGTTGETGPNTEAAINALAERNNIQKFSTAYDRDKGGDNLTAKREARLREAFPNAQIRDVREELGMQLGEDPNDLLRRLQAERQQQAERTQQQEQTRSAADNRPQPTQPTRDANQDKPSIERGQAQQPEQTQPEPALQAEPEQTHDHHQDRGMSR